MNNDTLWYQNAVFYQIYPRAYKDSNGDGRGDLGGIIQKLDYLQDLGIDCVWLMPLYPSPLKDDGYDISDFYGIHPNYGSLEMFKELLQQAHSRGIRVVIDMVLNHTSDQHAWFQQARSSRTSPYRDYYVWSDNPDKYGDARIIFLDTEKSNWSWDEQAGQYYWHRFYASQPDLNYDNPQVQEEMRQVMRYWLEMGVDGFRVDAVPYLYEREGTNCENLPETHAYLKTLRSLVNEYPGRILLCEANQWPEDVRPYFGDGDEFHMGFHFPLMPRIFMALRQGRRDSLEWVLKRTPPIPDGCQWCTFLRNHDELTLEMVTEEERQWMWREYAPLPRMRINLGIRRRLAPLLDNDRRKIELAYSLLFTLPGAPIIYYGDEIGMGDRISLPDRNGVRTPMQWEAGCTAGFSPAPLEKLYAWPPVDEQFSPRKINVQNQIADPGSLLNRLRRFIAARKQTDAFARGSMEWLADLPAGAAGYTRCWGEERILVANNLTEQPLNIPLGNGTWSNLLDPEIHYQGNISLAAYGYAWLMHQKDH